MEQRKIVLKEQAGLLWTWWKGDPLPPLPSLSDFTFAATKSVEVLATLMEVPATQIMNLLQEGHRPYLAYAGALPVAVGWSTSGRAQFGEGRVTFHIPPMNRYLYYFITLPTWRGQGIYPRLLQYIVRHERNESVRFWIIHQLSNIASERGIRKAGFQIASKVYFLNTGQLGLIPTSEEMERAHAGAKLLGLPLIKRTEDA